LQRFWYFRIDRVLRRLFADPDFVALRGKGRDSGWWASREATRIDGLLGGRLLKGADPEYFLPLEIAFDFGQMFVFRNHSTGLLCVRSGWDEDISQGLGHWMVD